MLIGLNKSFYNNTDIKFTGDIEKEFKNVPITDNVFDVGAIQYSIGIETNKFLTVFDHSKYIENNTENDFRV